MSIKLRSKTAPCKPTAAGPSAFDSSERGAAHWLHGHLTPRRLWLRESVRRNTRGTRHEARWHHFES